MAIALIEHPPYQVDFQQIIPEHEDTALFRMQNVALPTIFSYGFLIATATYDALVTNFEYVGTTFQYLVGGYDGVFYHFPDSQEELVARFALWVGAHVIGVFVLLGINLYNRIYAMPSNLLQWISPEIHTGHIKSEHADIDMSEVSEEIHTADLLNYFDEINFDDRHAAGYMPPSTRNELGTVYTPENLRQSLEVFVNHIRDRDSFLGTPPAYALPKLMQFYEQLENAVRFSMDKAQGKLQSFLRECGAAVPEPGHPRYNEYVDLLEDRARIAIDFAIAGKHCGARYMGDAMDAYLSSRGSADSGQLTLRDSLVEFLATERETIARRQIAIHLGADTHQFSAYMANLGQLLGIPGTENVVEYLGGFGFDRNTMLQHFFADYTPDFIREAVREKLRTSVDLRNKAYDWFKNQVSDWRVEDYRQKSVAILEAFPRREQLEQAEIRHENLETFTGMIDTLRAQGFDVDAIQGDSWEDTLVNLFNAPEARAFLEQRFPDDLVGNRIETMRKKAVRRQNIKGACLDPHFSATLQQILGGDAQVLALQPALKQVEYIRLANRVLQEQEIATLDPAVLARIYNGESNLREVLGSHLANDRASAFLAALMNEQQADPVAPEAEELAPVDLGVKDEVLDWFLISMGILKAPEAQEA